MAKSLVLVFLLAACGGKPSSPDGLFQPPLADSAPDAGCSSPALCDGEGGITQCVDGVRVRAGCANLCAIEGQQAVGCGPVGGQDACLCAPWGGAWDACGEVLGCGEGLLCLPMTLVQGICVPRCCEKGTEPCALPPCPDGLWCCAGICRPN